MDAPSFLRRHPGMRWLAPAGVLGLAALTAAGVWAGGSAAPKQLPRTTPDALIASVRGANVTGYTGTVVSRVALGLPELPSVGGGPSDGASFASLLTGSHTLQVWYGGAERQRIAVLGSTDETDVFRAGRSLWQWDSSGHVATHAVLPARGTKQSDAVTGLVGPHGGSPASALTPGGLAARVLAAIRPSTAVQVRRGQPVADRSTYDLVLTPRDASTLIGSVHVAIDGATKVPLEVQIFPRGSSTPAVDVAYTSISFGRPSRMSFQFSPPAGATVRQVPVAAIEQRLATTVGQAFVPSGKARLRISGSMWSTVACYHLSRPPALSGAMNDAFQPVSGSWGYGRVLEANLASVLLTHDGWLCAGAVAPSALYAAAAGR